MGIIELYKSITKSNDEIKVFTYPITSKYYNKKIKKEEIREQEIGLIDHIKMLEYLNKEKPRCME